MTRTDNLSLAMPIALLSLGALVGPMTYPALDAMAESFGGNRVAVELTVSGFFAGFALAHILLFPLGRHLGFRQILALGLIIFVLSSAVAAFAKIAGDLIAARIAQGIGYGMIPVATRALLCLSNDRTTATRNLSITGGAVFLFPIVTPFAGALLTDAIGWPAIFAAHAAYAALLLGLVLALTRETAAPMTEAASLKDELRSLFGTGRACARILPVVLLYAALMFLPFNIARVTTAMSPEPARDTGIIMALSFLGVALGSFLSARQSGRSDLLTFAYAVAILTSLYALVFSGMPGFALAAAPVAALIGATIWRAFSAAMLAGRGTSIPRSAALGFVQYAGSFALLTICSIALPANPAAHFAVIALCLVIAATSTRFMQAGVKQRIGQIL